jgi:hypothetical protein
LGRKKREETDVSAWNLRGQIIVENEKVLEMVEYVYGNLGTLRGIKLGCNEQIDRESE